jgi:hypothetical protein
LTVQFGWAYTVAILYGYPTGFGLCAGKVELAGVNIIGKQHFTSLLSPARNRSFTPKNIKVGFAASGLIPFNPDRAGVCLGIFEMLY